MSRLPTKEEILRHAKRIELADILTQGLPAITPEEHELKETGAYHKARIDLMRSPTTKIQAEELKYVSTMARELGLEVMQKKAFKRAERGMGELGYEWTNGWSKKEKPTPKPKWKITSKQSAQLADYYIKKCGETAYPCSMQEFEKFLSPNKNLKQTKREITRFFAKKKPQPIPRVSLRKPLDIGSAIRGRAKPISLAEKILPTTKPKKKKRQRLHVTRTGKTPRKLNGARKRTRRNGSKLFLFGSDVWKVKK